MLDFVRVLFYPSVSMSERQKLPRRSGVYYLRLGFQIQYIGQSTSLWHRWTNEGDWKHKQRIRIERSPNQKRYRLHYRSIPKRKLDWVEYSEIERFNPPYNVKRVNPQTCVDWQLRLELLSIDLIWMVVIGLMSVFLIWLVAK